MDVDADRTHAAARPRRRRGRVLRACGEALAAGGVDPLDGLIGVVTHIRGVRRKPGGFKEPLYNIVMGPPLLAPGSLVMVGAIGLLAAIVERERP